MHIDLIYAPSFFLPWDIGISIIGTIALLLLGFSAINLYCFFKKDCACKNNYLCFLGTGFLLLGFALLYEAITSILLPTNNYPFLSLPLLFDNFTLFVILRIIVARLLFLGAAFLIYLLVSKKDSLASKFLLAILLITNIFFIAQHSYILFYITLASIIFATSLQYFSLEQKNHNPITKLIAYFFFILGFSYILMIFVRAIPYLYIISKMIQLFGYSILFALFIKLHHGKKKK